MHIYKDKESGITHIRTEAGIALCGLHEGWTTEGVEPVKKKYGVTCEDCQDEVSEMKRLKATGD